MASSVVGASNSTIFACPLRAACCNGVHLSGAGALGYRVRARVSTVENPNEQDINGLTPVQSAINGGHWEVVKIFALFVDNDEAKDALGWSSIYNNDSSDPEDPLSFKTNEEEIVGQNDVNENEKKHKIETEEEDGGTSPSKRAKLENDFPDATKIHNDDDDEDSNPKNESIEKNDSNDNKRKMENEDEEGSFSSPKKAKTENENDLGISSPMIIKKDEKNDESVELMLEEDNDAANESINISSNVEQMADEPIRCSSMITHWIPFY